MPVASCAVAVWQGGRVAGVQKGKPKPYSPCDDEVKAQNGVCQVRDYSTAIKAINKTKQNKIK